MSKAFDATVQIVAAKLGSSTIPATPDGGAAVAGFIREIYKEFSTIEIAECSQSGNFTTAAKLD